MAIQADPSKIPREIAFEISLFLATFLPSDPVIRRAVIAAAMGRDIRMGYVEAPASA